MSFACFLCTPRNFRSRKRPCCHDLDHFLLVLIATLSVHSILRIYVTGVTAIHPIYIQAVSSQTLTATCLEGPDWNCDRNSEDDDWKENMREATSKNWKNWKVKVLHLLMCWKLLWNIVMNRVHGRLQHWYRDIIGWDLWCCIGVCYVVGKQPGRGGQPVDVWIFGQKICDLMRTFDVKVTFDATGLVPGSHYRHEFHKFHESLYEYYESGLTQEMSLFSCEALHQPRWRKPHGRHWPLHLCPVAKMRSNTEAMYVFSVKSFMCSSSTTEYAFQFAKLI